MRDTEIGRWGDRVTRRRGGREIERWGDEEMKE